jgi:murein L,D-transpeptidase YcbB/YkuD
LKNEIMPQVDRDPDCLERNNIEAVGTSGREETRLRQRPGVKEPIPVSLAYFTAWEDNGTLQIRPDVYGHDRRHLE